MRWLITGCVNAADEVDRVLRSEAWRHGAGCPPYSRPTKGCTTWTMKVTVGGKTYNVVILGSPNVNPGYKLVDNKAYPEIAQDYERMWRVLKSLPCDVFLGAHGGYFGMEEKYHRLQAGGENDSSW